MSWSRRDDGRARTDGGTAGDDLGQWASLGVATYLVLALGTAISVFLLATVAGVLGPSGTGTGTSPLGVFGGGLAGSITVAFGVLVVSSATVATALGLFIGATTADGSSPIAGAVANAAGVLVAAVVMTVFLVILDEGAASGTSGLLTLVGAVVGLTVGVAATGAAAAGVGNRLGS